MMKSITDMMPIIRYKEFSEPWIRCKLSELLIVVTDKNRGNYTKKDVLSVSDEFGCINQIRFQGRSFAGEDISNYKIASKGDIIYTRSPLKSKPYGIIKIVDQEEGIVSPLYIVNKVKHGYDSQFIYRVFDSPLKTNKYLSPLVRKGAKNTMNISNDEWLSGEINIAPSIKEQKRIGGYFYKLDYIISLYQRKLGQQKKLKKYFLQNMFPAKGEKVPKIRLKGFAGDWKQSELEELATFSKGIGYSKSDLLDSGKPIILYGRLYTKYETVITNTDTFVDEKDGSVHSLGGEVIVPASGETAEDISIASVVKKSGIIIGGDLNIIHPSNNIDSTFLAISISNGEPHKDMARRAQGKSVVHLHNDDLSKIKLWYPSLEEQRRIGQYFCNIDSLINLNQHKINELQTLKKYMIQNMFI